MTLVLEVAVGLGLAGIVSARGGALWFRVAIFTPVMLPMVVVAILWSFVYNPDFGLVNAALGGVGLEELQRVWLGDTSTALLAVCVVSGWVFAGFYMMIFYAAFRQIPSEVIEAARLDGAGEWALFRRVKVPMIRNAVAVAVLLCVTGGFQGFDLFFVLTNGGPYGATEIPTTYLVKTVFRNGEVGYGSAMAVILTAIVLGVGLLYARLQRPAARAAVDTARDARPGRDAGRRPAGAREPGRPTRSRCRRRAPARLLGASLLRSSSSRWSGWCCRASRPTRRSSRTRSRCPASIDLSRWVEAWEVGHIGQYAVNSAIATAVSVTAILLMGAGGGVRDQPLPVPRSDGRSWASSRWGCCCRCSRTSSPSRRSSRSWRSRTRASR